MRTPSAMAAHCAAGTFHGQGGWRQPTQREVTEFAASRATIPNYFEFSTIVSSTPSGTGFFGVQGPMGTPFVAEPTQVFPRTVCVSQPQNMAYSGNLTWYRNTQTVMPLSQMSAACASLSVMGKGGWRMPTRTEAQAFYDTRAFIPNAPYWQTVNPGDASIATSTAFEGGQFVIALANGSTAGAPPGWVGRLTCVVGDGLPATGADWAGLRWYRDPTGALTSDLAGGCASLTALGITGGWRQPTRDEASSFYANRAAIPQFAAWLAIPGPDFLLTSTPVAGGFFAIDLQWGNEPPVGPTSGIVTCVTTASPGGLPAGWADACATNNGGCSPNAVCGVSGGSVTCTCRPGFTGNGVTCTDTNECATNNGGCSANATCTNTPGSFTCTCNAGFTGAGGDGFVCHENNECLVNNGGCSSNAMCSKVPGGRVCTCRTGYEGNGTTCSVAASCAASTGLARMTEGFEWPVTTSFIYEPPEFPAFTMGGITTGTSLSPTASLMPSEGRQFAFLNASGAFSLSARVPAGTFSLTVLAARSFNQGGTAQPVSVYANGVLVGSFTPTVTTRFTSFTIPSFTLPQGQRSIRIQQAAGAATLLFDAVTLSVVSPTTPAPTGCGANATCDSNMYSCSCNTGFSGNGYSCADVNECTASAPNHTARSGGLSWYRDTTSLRTNSQASTFCTTTSLMSQSGWRLPTQAEASALFANRANVKTYQYLTTLGDYIMTSTTSGSGTVTVKLSDGSTSVSPSGSIGYPFCVSTAVIPNVTCNPYASCANTTGGFTCTCLSGFTGDGVNVCNDINECLTNNGGCSVNASCANAIGGRVCTCNTGYTGNGVTCSDVNECLTNNGGCSVNAICSNTPGSRTCACAAGFTGDGLTCTDVNECLTNNGGCSVNAVCTNTPGSRTCACSAGYTGNGVTCTDVNECLTNNGGCSVNATCTNTPGGRTCACATGYTGDGTTCTDVNECLTNNGGCSVNASCTNTPGSRTCACAAGYTGDGVTCTDINECLVGNGGCHPNATCTNTGGSRTCACNPGYSGNGFSCVMATLSVSATHAVPGSSVTVTLESGVAGSGNTLAIGRVGTPDTTTLASVAATGTSLTWAPTLSVGWGPGQFEFRYLLSGSSVAAARSAPFSVVAAPTFTTPATTHVGATPSTVTATARGAGSVTIPLTTPPGVGAISPVLALRYDSQATDGPFGYGWSLTGLSAITRCAKTLASNGEVGAVTMSSADRFCLDGAPLKLTGGKYGAAGSTYATELETFSRIVANGAGPATLTVTSKAGLISTYGGGSGVAPSTGTTRSWLLTQIADRVGNSLRLNYDNVSQSAPRVMDVQYPFTASGQGPFYKVEFTYEARPDPLAAYIAGSLVQDSTRVKEISVLSLPGSTLIRKYRLTYDQGPTTARSRLRSVQECVPSGCLPATDVQYSVGGSGFDLGPIESGGSAGGYGPWGSETLISVDFDGNGRSDMFFARPPPVGSPYTWNFLMSPRAQLANSGTTPGFGSEITITNDKYSERSRPTPGRFSGAGRFEIAIPIPNQTTGLDPVIHIYSYNGLGFTDLNTGIAAPFGGLEDSPFYNVVADVFAGAADVNGDGLTDLVFARTGWIGCTGPECSATGGITARLNQTPPGGSISFGMPVSIFEIPPSEQILGIASDRIRFTDFNRDGAADIVLQSHPRWYVLRSNPGQQSTIVKRVTVDTFVSNHLDVVDWNGDGCEDIILGLDTGRIEFSNCLDGFVPGPEIPLEASTTLTTIRHFIDYDGDGRRDLLYNDYHPATATWSLMLARSTGLGVAAPVAITDFQFGGMCGLPRPTPFTDADGDGLSDFATFTCAADQSTYAVNGWRVWRRRPGSDGLPPDMVTRVVSSAGLTHDLRYASIAREGYQRGSGAVFPVADMQAPVLVVKELVHDDGIGGTYSVSHSYTAGRTHGQGRGFLGFQTRSMTDSRNGVTTTETFGQTFPFIGQLLGFNQTALGRTLLTKVVTPGQQVLGAGFEARVFPFADTVVTTEYEAGGPKNGKALVRETVVTTYGDGYGNPTRVLTTKTDLDTMSPASPFGGQSLVKDQTFTYDNVTSNWCLGLLATDTQTRTAPGMPALTASVAFGRDTTLCRITSATVEPGNSLLSTTTSFGFDSCGNRSSSTVTGRRADGSLMAPRTTLTGYGTRCQLPETVTDALSQTTQTGYDYRFGVPVSRTDLNGLTTSWALDEYGRVVREVRPDGTYALTRFDATTCPTYGSNLKFGTFTDSYSLTGQRVKSSGACTDAMMRPRTKMSFKPRGSALSFEEVRTYDALGRLARSDRPTANGSTANGFARLTYDVLNRVSARTVYDAAGVVAANHVTTFLGRTTRVVDPRGNTTTTVSDVHNHRVSVTEPSPGGTTTFTFDAFGRPKQTTDAINKTRTIGYNALGFVTSVVDPDRGTTTLTVNSLGETTRQVDAKLQVVDSTYDALGRMLTRTEPEGTTTWTWGSTPGTRGRVTLVTGLGVTETQTYDWLSRLVRRATQTPDLTAPFNYRYDEAGQLEMVTYPPTSLPTPARVAVRSLYSEGVVVQLDDVTSAARTIWRANTFADDGAIVSQVAGATSPVTVTSSYEPHTGRVAGIQAGVGGMTSNRQSLRFGWDANGNLDYRNDLFNMVLQEFVNDPLNRVTSSRINGAVHQTFGYDPSGNISSRSDVGSYAYDDTSHPHAVTAAGTNTYGYDANGNATTKNGSTQTWASFNLPTVLRANGQTTTFTYAPDRRLIKQVASYPAAETTHFLGEGLERLVTVSGEQQERYVLSPSSAVRLMLTRSSAGSQLRTLVLDHIGSTTSVIADATGAAELTETFDVFGKRAAAVGWANAPSAASVTAFGQISRIGFTGHQHLDNLGLTHMKGRVYDPTIGRFLSVDPLVGKTVQALNPYSYVSNRPLSLVDPTGEAEGVEFPMFPPMMEVRVDDTESKKVELEGVSGLRDRTVNSFKLDSVGDGTLMCPRPPESMPSEPSWGGITGLESAFIQTAPGEGAWGSWAFMGDSELRLSGNLFVGKMTDGKPAGIAGGFGLVVDRNGYRGLFGAVLGVSRWGAYGGAGTDATGPGLYGQPSVALNRKVGVGLVMNDPVIGDGAVVSVPGKFSVMAGDKGFGGSLQLMPLPVPQSLQDKGYFANVGVGAAVTSHTLATPVRGLVGLVRAHWEPPTGTTNHQLHPFP